VYDITSDKVNAYIILDRELLRLFACLFSTQIRLDLVDGLVSGIFGAVIIVKQT
jgi:hypothetical protein